MDGVFALVILGFLSLLVAVFISGFFGDVQETTKEYTVDPDYEARALIALGWIEEDPIGLYHPQTGMYFAPDGTYHTAMSFDLWKKEHGYHL